MISKKRQPSIEAVAVSPNKHGCPDNSLEIYMYTRKYARMLQREKKIDHNLITWYDIISLKDPKLVLCVL
jgi:hypothetical protein